MNTDNSTPQTSDHPRAQAAPQNTAPQYAQPEHPQQLHQGGSSAVQQQPMSHQVTFVRQSTGPKGLSIASMVIGLVSIFLGFTFILPLIGFILGVVGLKKEPAGRGMAITGVVLSGLILAVWAVLIFSGVGLIGLGLSNQ